MAKLIHHFESFRVRNICATYDYGYVPFVIIRIYWILSSSMLYRCVCNKSNTMGATSEAGTTYPSGAPEFTPGFQWYTCSSHFYFCAMMSSTIFPIVFTPICFVGVACVICNLYLFAYTSVQHDSHMFVSFNNNTTCATSGAWAANP